MVDIWKYAKTLPKLTITTIDGEKLSGKVIGVFDAEEFEDEEDSLALELSSGRVVSIFPSEIQSARED